MAFNLPLWDLMLCVCLLAVWAKCATTAGAWKFTALLLLLCVLQTTSEKALRKQLQQHFKTDMNEKKAFIKEHVSLSRTDTSRLARALTTPLACQPDGPVRQLSTAKHTGQKAVVTAALCGCVWGSFYPRSSIRCCQHK